jgi:hypothetical protein
MEENPIYEEIFNSTSQLDHLLKSSHMSLCFSHVANDGLIPSVSIAPQQSFLSDVVDGTHDDMNQ